jgi:hypothetical protein
MTTGDPDLQAIGNWAYVRQRAFQQVLRAKHLLTMGVFQFGSWA